ncbi:MAG TPA: CHAT domain-containing tetratricopeptide repeat protein [Chryseosolibacter sp.]
MKRILFFLLTLMSAAAFGQKLPKLYTDIVDNFSQEKFETIVGLTNEVEAFARSRKDTLVANSFYYVAKSYHSLGEIEKSNAWFEKEKALRSDLGLASTAEFSGALYHLSLGYLEEGKYSKAEAMATDLLANDKKMYGPRSEDFFFSLQSVVDIYTQLDKFPQAEKLILESLGQQEKGSYLEGALHSELGGLYTATAQFAKAAKHLTQALDILEKVEGPTSPYTLAATVNFGILYMSQGKYAEAEEAFDFVLTNMSPDDPTFLNVVNNQALVYHWLGQYERAEKMFKQVREADSLSIGDTHPDFAITLSNLGVLYSDEGKHTSAENALLKALEVQRLNKEEGTVLYAVKLNNLARIYRLAGQPQKAIPLLEQALGTFKEILGENSPDFANTSFHLGMSHWQTGNMDLAIHHLKSSASIRASKLGKKHPKYAESLQKIAEFHWEKKQLKEAQQAFNEAFGNYYFQINSLFPVLTEEEKSKFYYTNIKPAFEKFNSFALIAMQSNPQILGEVYDHHINTKAAIMYATEKVKESIRKSNDTTLIRLFDRWQFQKEQIAKLYSQNDSPEKIDSLQQSADLLEKELTRGSAVFTRQLTRKTISWKDIQKNLKADEAAVEVIRFKNYSPALGGAFTNDIIYGFLIVTAKTKNNPELIVLKNGIELEGKFLTFYRNNIQFTLDDTRSYKNYFEPLAKALAKQKVKRIYFSRDGVYNQININTIKNTETQKFLLDAFEVTLVTNTRELLEKRTTRSNSQSSLLIGFPKFNLHSAAEKAEVTTRSVTRGGNISRGLRGGLLRHMRGEGGIAVLPGTQVEINQIAKISKNPEIFMEDLAAEGLIKQVISPMVLHIATHGYFLEDDETTTTEQTVQYVPSPLLKSGLLLAGSENFLKTGTPVNDDGDDGILTAYEAMNLNLENTDLVVLSACETGLGVVKNGEGVYGLQRAFKMAGAQSMIMSLWSVDDAATQQLMSLFYQERSKTSDLHVAFRNAQQKLKQTYPHPFYWGAFIMVGI